MALLVAGCSRGGGNHSAPTTTNAAPSRVVAVLGGCPQSNPVDSLTTINRRVAGLGSKLIPIAASGVLICEYRNTLVGSDVLSDLTASKLEVVANRLMPTHGGLVGCERGQNPPPPPPSFMLRFSNGVQQVEVGDVCGGTLWNGLLVTEDPLVAAFHDRLVALMPSTVQPTTTTTTPRCRSVHVTLGSGHAEGTTIFQVWLNSPSQTSCEISGYPTLSVLDLRGKPLPIESVASNLYGKPTAVRLAPGQQRGPGFIVGWSNWCGSRSSNASSINVTLPLSPHVLVAAFAAAVSPPRCDDAKQPSTLNVSPILHQVP